jgi:hypothetical protein
MDTDAFIQGETDIDHAHFLSFYYINGKVVGDKRHKIERKRKKKNAEPLLP